jgi:hypothetical protein
VCPPAAAQRARGHRAHAARHGVVPVDRQRGADRGFFGLQTDDDDRLCGGGSADVRFRPGFFGRARSRRGAAAAGKIDGGHRASASRRIGLGFGDPSLGLRFDRRRNVVHHHAVEIARPD